MPTKGQLQIDPPAIDSGGQRGPIEIAILHTEWAVTEGVMNHVVAFTANLDATVTLIAVHTIPYPMSFGCPALVHARLVEQLIELASRCPLPVNPLVVLARSCAEGFRHALEA